MPISSQGCTDVAGSKLPCAERTHKVFAGCHALGGHKQLGTSGPLAVRRAVLATGWYWSASLVLLRGTDVSCMCQIGSSGPHVTWTCPITAACSEGLTIPRERAAEMLFAAAVPEWPSAPPTLTYKALLGDISDHCRQLLSSQAFFRLPPTATFFHGVGGYAVVIAEPDGVFATGDSSEDRSAYRQEALAMLALFRGLLSLAGTCTGRIHLI